jgi:hypothetical protein
VSEKPNDRPSPKGPVASNPEPQIFVIVNGQKFPRPSLQTFFETVPKDPKEEGKPGCSCHPVVGTFCSCNKVCTCVPACGCVGHSGCSCHSHSRPGGGGCSCVPVVTGCRCAPVH